MKLLDILKQSDLGEDENATIYVEQPWSLDAEAIVVSPAPQLTTAVHRDGRHFGYFLEAFIAREFLDDLDASGDVRASSETERYRRLIRYAQADA